MDNLPSFGLLVQYSAGSKNETVIGQKGKFYRQKLERPDALGERRGRGAEPAEARNSVDLPLENARIDRLSSRDSNSAAHVPKKISQFGHGCQTMMRNRVPPT